MRRRFLPALVVLAALIGCERASLPETLLPAKLAGLEASGPARVFEGEKLYDYINGGAVQFYAHGFRRAVVRKYKYASGEKGAVTVDLFEMNSPEGAAAVFKERSMGEGALSVGMVSAREALDEGEVTEGYAHFRAGSFYGTVTVFEGDLSKDAALKLARAFAAQAKHGTEPRRR